MWGDEGRSRCSRAPPRSRSSGAARGRAAATRSPRCSLVGANPLYVIYALGGAHNDLIMMLADDGRGRADASRGRATRRGRRRRVVVAGALVKATVARAAAVHDPRPAQPRADARRARRRSRWARCSPTPRSASHGVNIVAALNRDAAFVSTDSFATEIAHLFGKPGVFPIDHDLLKVALVADRRCTCCGAPGAAMTGSPPRAGRCWRSRSRAPGCSPGTSSGRCRSRCISRDRRLLVATLALQGLFIAHQLTPLFAPGVMSDARGIARAAASDAAAATCCARASASRPGSGRHVADRDDALVLVGLLLAIATVNDVVLQTHVNHRLDRRPAHVARLHRPRLQERLDRTGRLRTTRRRDVVCGNTAPGPPKERIADLPADDRPGRAAAAARSHGAGTCRRSTKTSSRYRYGCFGSTKAQGACPR